MATLQSLGDTSLDLSYELRALRLALQDASSDPPRLTLRISEAAARCGVSKETFEKYFLPELRVVSAGTGPRRIRLVLPSDLVDLMEARGVRPLDRFDPDDADVFQPHRLRGSWRDDAES